MHPGPRAVGPDIHHQFHVVRRIQRADLEHQHLRNFRPLAVDGRAAVWAEIAVQDVSALGGVGEQPGFAGGKGHRAGRNHGVMAGAGAGRFLAMSAVTGNDFFDWRADAVADIAAQTAAGDRVRHGIFLDRFGQGMNDTLIDAPRAWRDAR